MRKPDRAVCDFERFVSEVKDPDPALLADAKAKIERLSKTLGKVDVQAPDGAVLFIDADERATAPAKLPICVQEGQRRVVALVTGVAPVGIDIDVKAGEVVKVALDPATNTAKLLSPLPEPPAVAITPPTTPPSKPVADKQPLGKKWWLWTAVGGVVLVAAAAGLAVGLQPPNVTAPMSDYGPFKVFP